MRGVAREAQIWSPLCALWQPWQEPTSLPRARRDGEDGAGPYLAAVICCLPAA